MILADSKLLRRKKEENEKKILSRKMKGLLQKKQTTTTMKENGRIYKGESKVLQYSDNVRHNSLAVDAFVKVVKVINFTERF